MPKMNQEVKSMNSKELPRAYVAGSKEDKELSKKLAIAQRMNMFARSNQIKENSK